MKKVLCKYTPIHIAIALPFPMQKKYETYKLKYLAHG